MTRPRPVTTPRCVSGSSGRCGPGLRRMSSWNRAPRPESRPVRPSRRVPMPSSRSRRRRRSTSDGNPTGPRGREARGPVPAACLVHVVVRPRDSVRDAAATLPKASPSWRRARSSHRRPSPSRPAPVFRSSPCTGGRASRSSPPATRCGARAKRWDPPGSPTRTAPDCEPWSATRAPSRWTSGSRWTGWTTSAIGSGAACRMSTPSS